jgi:hypothetical protein
MPVVDIAKGRISFRHEYAAPAVGPVGAGETQGMASCPVRPDNKPPDYVSLASQNIRICAADFRIVEFGDIHKVGWVNIIQESSRNYHYEDGMIVTESITLLPTWDGEADDTRPFYFGTWYSVDEDDEDSAGCQEILERSDDDDDNPVDIIFTDAPCMPPSYGYLQHGGLELGKFNISPAGYQPTLMTRISGLDRYLACLAVFDDDDQHHVAWAVPWDVTYNARVAAAPDGRPVVVVAPESLTRLNTGAAANPAALIAQVLPRVPSAAQKTYQANQPVRRIVVRRGSTSDLTSAKPHLVRRWSSGGL